MTKPVQATQPAADADEDARAPRIVHAPLPPAMKKAALLTGVAIGAAAMRMLTRETPGQRPAASPEERRQPQAGGRGTRSLALTPDSYDAEAHTVEAILSVGAAVQRYFFIEELEISPEAVDLTRVTAGVCPVLDTHNGYELAAQIGRVIGARVEGGELIGTLQFDQTDAGQEIEARVARGELRAISIGYQVTTWQITSSPGSSDTETWRAMNWQLLEASFVPVPADPNAVVRSANGNSQHGTTEEDNDMRRNHPGGAAAAAPASSTAAPAASDTTIVIEQGGGTRAEPHNPAGAAATSVPPAAPVSASRILDMCARSPALGSDFANELIRANEATPFSEADLLGRVNERLIGQPRASIDARAGASGTEEAGYRQAIEDALTLRTNPGATLIEVEGFSLASRLTAAREFRGMTLMELGRDFLGRTGIDVRGMGRLEIAGAALGMRYGALSTSDFANALANTANRRVRAAFQAAPQTFRPLITADTLPDFKAATLIALGDAPALLNVPEGAEFKRGSLTDSGVSYALATYGRVIAITRQAIVNDDKRLFNQVPAAFGRKSADLESDLVWGTVLANPTMPDGFALFSSQHGNLAASGGAISVTTVAAGEQAMLSQTNPDGGYIVIRPAYLIVGPAKKVEAQIFLTAVTATQTANVNPYPGTLTLIVDPRITGNQWYLAADPADYEGLILAHLDGQEELFLETRVGFDVDGIETKARLDVGAAMIDYRGWYKNPGN